MQTVKVKNISKLKKALPVDFPIGVRSKQGVLRTEMVKPGDCLEMSAEEAQEFIALQNPSFPCFKIEVPAKDSPEIEAPRKKPGRKPKSLDANQ